MEKINYKKLGDIVIPKEATLTAYYKTSKNICKKIMNHYFFYPVNPGNFESVELPTSVITFSVDYRVE